MRSPNPQKKTRIYILTLLIAVAAVSSVILMNPVEIPNQHVSAATPSYVALITARARTANSVVFQPRSGKLIASIPSGWDSVGNSIAWIDPLSGKVEKSVWVGSEPNKLALANDGNTLYVSLDGSRSIRAVDLRSGIPGNAFQAGFTNYDGPLMTIDLSISPTNKNVVAVTRRVEARSNAETVAIFENGVQRPSIAPSIAGVAFTNSESVLIGSDANADSSEVFKLTVDATGIASSQRLPALARGPRIRFAGGRIYTSRGHVVDPATGALMGTFPIINPVAELPFAIDEDAGRAYYLSRDGSTPRLTIQAFDIQTFGFIGSADLQQVNTGIKEIVRWGSNGLALTSEWDTYIIQSDLVGPGPIQFPAPRIDSVPIPTLGGVVRRIPVPNNGLIYNKLDQKFYVSVPGTAAPALANTITRLDPVSGETMSSVFVGSEPNELALSDDGSTLYTSLDGASAIRRYNTLTQTAGLQFTPANNGYPTSDLKVLPGSPQTVAVSAGDGGVAIYDDGIKRPTSPNIEVGPIEHNGTPNTLYGYNDLSTGFNLYKLAVSPSGLNIVSNVQNLIYRFNTRMIYDSGRLYCSDGRVVDPETNTIVGKFRGVDYYNGLGMAVDSAAGKAYYLVRRSESSDLMVFDINTFNLIGITTLYDDLLGRADRVTDMFRWGHNGLAMRTTTWDNQTSILLLRTPLVAVAKPFDFDGDGRSDIGIARPSGMDWWIDRSSEGTFATHFGLEGDQIVPEDYTGDGKTDIAVWRPTTHEWFVLASENSTVKVFTFGETGDIPVPADWGTDGQADAAVFRPSNSTWYIRFSTNGVLDVQFGRPGDIPVPFDHTGDGRIDWAVYRPSSGEWELSVGLPQTKVLAFGTAEDKPVTADYTGDGKPDIAVWRPSTGEWFILRSEDPVNYYVVKFGLPEDIPAPADYDGDGVADVAVFRPSTGTWYVQRSTSGLLIQRFGIAGDKPLTAAYVH